MSRRKKIDGLLKNLKDDPRRVRSWAATALGRMSAREAVPELVEVLRVDESSLVRSKAVLALEEMGATEAIPSLIQTMQTDKDSMVRRLATWTLGEFREAAIEAVPTLIEVMKTDEDKKVRGWAARALADIGAEEAIPELIGSLQDENEDVRWRAAYALGLMGAKEAIEPIREMINDNMSEEEKFHFAVALARLEKDEEGENGIKIIHQMEKGGELSEWYTRNFERRLDEEFNLKSKIEEMVEETACLRETIEGQPESESKEELMKIVESQEKMINNFQHTFAQMMGEIRLLRSTKGKESWWSRWSGEIIVGIIGAITTIIATIVAAFT